MRRFAAQNESNTATICLIVSLVAGGCQQKMAAQPSYDAFQACEFFDDGTSAQHPPPNTVARGHLRLDTALYTGRVPPAEQESETGDNGAAQGGDETNTQKTLAAEASAFVGVVDEFPLPVTREIVEHGRNRYMIYCAVCHDALGTGRGKIVERGYSRPPSYHIERLRRAPVGHFFRVITEGYGSMPSYAAQIPTRDRWAIVAYVRALQLSQHYPEDELPDPLRRKWEETEKKLAEH